MARTATVTILFTDIVGSTELLHRLGESKWDDIRRSHFAVLRTALAHHEGVEIKNTGDGVMASFASAVDAVDCSVAVQRGVEAAVASGTTPVHVRIGIATGEAVAEDGDWFGTPVVEAARLCAAAASGSTLATAVVAALAGSSATATYSTPELRTLKGFDGPTAVVTVEPVAGDRGSAYALPHLHGENRDVLVRQLEYWESLAGIRKVRAYSAAQLALMPGDVLCGIGCGPGTELLRLRAQVAPGGTVIGVDPSAPLLDVCAQRASAEPLDSVELTLIARDGRDTGLDNCSVDALRIERVIQHTGDIEAFLAEALRILRPGGRISLIDTDWGSLMIHPGNPEMLRRIKGAMESGYLADPWSGRKLHGALLAAGFQSTSHELFAISAESGIHDALRGASERLLAGTHMTDDELRDFMADGTQAMDEGWGTYDFCMYVASGRKAVT